jgi:single-stranded-DNA-specific exonuclease
MGNPGVRLLVPGASVGDIRPMGEAERHARFSLRSGRRRALGVAFGVNGALATAAQGGPLDVSVKLELNEWNGAVEPRVVLGELYPCEGEPGADEEIDAAEFSRRARAELEAELAWPPAFPVEAGEREEVDRRKSSGVATVAALASSGKAVLALCADAIRRRELVERAARPARFGGGEVAIVSARLPEAAVTAAETRVAAAGAGVVLADWAALARDPALAGRFEHLVVIDPPPFAHLESLCRAGSGFLHRLDGRAEAEFALRVHTEDWPSRAWLAGVYRSLSARLRDAGIVEAAMTRTILCGEGRAHPLAPEAAARSARVLAELGLVVWDGSGGLSAPSVVSSEGTDLDRSQAFVAYRDRYEEGRRFLSERRQS